MKSNLPYEIVYDNYCDFNTELEQKKEKKYEKNKDHTNKQKFTSQ